MFTFNLNSHLKRNAKMRTTDVCQFIKLNEEATNARKPNYNLLEITELKTKCLEQIYKANIECLIVNTDIFQVRDIDSHLTGNHFISKTHINSLKKPLLNPDKELDPITIGWARVNSSNWEWVVIDGHHRIEAYRKAKRAHVPVVVFEGTAREMVLESIKGNNQDKLPMTATDKIEAAWTIWVAMMGDKERWRTVKALGPSPGTMSNFNKTEKRYAEKLKKYPENLQSYLSSMTWREARRDDMNEVSQTNFDNDKLVRQWCEGIFKEFGHKGKQSPEVFFSAIELYMGEQKFQSMIEYYSINHEEEEV
jgi:hypothetical protein